MFTGSTATGQLLAEQAGRRLIGFSAELGGKNPMIVAAGADLREVTDAAVRACFSNSGQLCISIERIYVEESIAPEFIRMFGDRVKKMNLAAGYEFGIEMVSLVPERSEARRVGKGGVSQCRYRCSPVYQKKKHITNNNK